MLHVYLAASLGTTAFGLPCVEGEAAASFPELGLSVKMKVIETLRFCILLLGIVALSWQHEVLVSGM